MNGLFSTFYISVMVSKLFVITLISADRFTLLTKWYMTDYLSVCFLISLVDFTALTINWCFQHFRWIIVTNSLIDQLLICKILSYLVKGLRFYFWGGKCTSLVFSFVIQGKLLMWVHIHRLPITNSCIKISH